MKTQTDRTDRQIEVASTIKTAAYDAASNLSGGQTDQTDRVCAQCNAGLRTDPSSDAPTIKVKSDSAEVSRNWLPPRLDRGSPARRKIIGKNN